jgi:1-acyl-sn-glycerol-3-phosphate acyltransferase
MERDMFLTVGLHMHIRFPMAITHTRDIIKDHIPFVKPTHVTIQYGTPVYPNELPKEEKRALGRYTQNIIQEMLDHEKAGSL